MAWLVLTGDCVIREPTFFSTNAACALMLLDPSSDPAKLWA